MLMILGAISGAVAAAVASGAAAGRVFASVSALAGAFLGAGCSWAMSEFSPPALWATPVGAIIAHLAIGGIVGALGALLLHRVTGRGR